MVRHKVLKTISDVTTGSTTSPKIDVRDRSAAAFKAPADTTHVDFYVAETADDSAPAVLADHDDAAVGFDVTAGQWYPFPDECFAIGYVVVVLTGPAGAVDMKVWLAA